MRKKKALYKALTSRVFGVLCVVLFLFVIALSTEKETIVTYNANRTKSLEAIHIVSKYNNLLENIQPLFVNSISEIAKHGPESPLTFTGLMTGYGPDCVGCGGRVGCSPRQDVRNGNIYFEDADYGTVRIVASDTEIPCGSIVEISGLTFTSDTITAIVLDRGGAIVGKKFDLLYESEAASNVVGFQRNVNYNLIRWGW